ncbi:CoA-dependent acyltransferase [Sistotremastrum suecicum HHB10207 ss-3]|uniref:Dihydrolipoamide acetyltransferase component of pyruvate dehydrogenase complex n=1 Tax=Sistotremastrum suecicum HHB10207 ss-3 TaxID=1314776 RepID=A0A166F9F8_9AGAM|nr:CoA-dependent acyltransferase [Sistotremastrum suecicum HHB10207 ss-3]
MVLRLSRTGTTMLSSTSTSSSVQMSQKSMRTFIQARYYRKRHPSIHIGATVRAAPRGVRCDSQVASTSLRPVHTSSPRWSPPSSKKTLQTFKLADIGEGITECEIIRWSIAPGQKISAFDPLCEVQSDKASVEITSPFDGVLKEVMVKEGEVAKVGAGLCVIEVDAEGEDAEGGASVVEEVADMEEIKKIEKKIERSSMPPRPSTPSSASSSSPEARPRRPHPLDPNYTPPPPPKPSSSSSTPSSGKSARDVLATPSVRHLARQKGIDITLLSPGSGKGGRVEKSDIETYLASSSTSVETTEGAKASQPREEGMETVVELGRTRWAMWRAMTKSLDIPHFGYSTYLDITSIHQLLPILNANIPPHFLPSSHPIHSSQKPVSISPLSIYGVNPPTPPSVDEIGRYAKLTYLPILLKTLSKAMMEWPLFRSSITPSPPSTTPSPSPTDAKAKPTLTIRPTADISLALSTPTGLYTPTLLSTSSLSIYQITSTLRRFQSLALSSKLTPAEMPKKGGTISVSNVGSIGKGEFASPVLVEGGGVAIVAIGRARWVREWDLSEADVFDLGGGPGGMERKKGPRLIVGVSWSADHRVVEGAEMAAFVECWRGWVEHPERLIGDGR